MRDHAEVEFIGVFVEDFLPEGFEFGFFGVEVARASGVVLGGGMLEGVLVGLEGRGDGGSYLVFL